MFNSSAAYHCCPVIIGVITDLVTDGLGSSPLYSGLNPAWISTNDKQPSKVSRPKYRGSFLLHFIWTWFFSCSVHFNFSMSFLTFFWHTINSMFTLVVQFSWFFRSGPKKKMIHLVLVHLAFTQSFLTLNLKIPRKPARLLWHVFCDRTCWTSKAMLFAGLNALAVCEYIHMTLYD